MKGKVLPHNSPSVALTLVWALAVLLVVLVQTQKLEAELLRVELTPPPEAASAALPSGKALRLVAVGYPEAMADVIWLDALSFLGENLRREKVSNWLAPYLEAITTLDPQFSLVYRWAATVVMYGSVINNQTVSESNEILEVAIERFPESWELHFMLGVNYLHELRARDEQQRAEHVRYGTRMLAKASRLPEAPDWLVAAASSWANRSGSWDSGRRSAIELHMMNTSVISGRTGRFRLEDALGWSLAMPVLSDRRVMRCIERHPRWAIVPPALAAFLHPDPVWLCPNDELYPPPLSEPQ